MRYIGKSVKFILDFLEIAPLWLGMALFVTMTSIAFAGVIMRYTVHSPITWEAEVTSFMMAWGVFLGVGTVTRHNAHIRIAFFAEKIFGEKRGPIVWSFMETILGMGLCGYIAYLGARWVKLSYDTGAASLGDIRYELWIPRMAVSIGLSLMVLFYFERFVKQLYRWTAEWRGWDIEEKKADKNILAGV